MSRGEHMGLASTDLCDGNGLIFHVLKLDDSDRRTHFPRRRRRMRITERSSSTSRIEDTRCIRVLSSYSYARIVLHDR